VTEPITITGAESARAHGRLNDLLAESREILDAALQNADKPVVAIVALFSGGNDSTTLAHIFRDQVDYYAHANTGIGIEETRQYVRATCKSWGKPLLEFAPEPGKTYEDLILGRCKPGPRGRKDLVWPGGFPGPAQHGMFFQRLKERQLERVRNVLVNKPRKERVIFLAGRRAEESARRTSRFMSGDLKVVERRGSIIWVSPLINWTKLDLNAYRRRFPDVPRNEVSDLLHMSGECLCGCFGHPDELEEIRIWFPDDAAYIDDLERQVREANLPGVKAEHCKWNWKGQGVCNTGMCNN
jgi:3'-phosphoadenosine 5'-phosphosulfate sulfotransferase (PAPS reductase)/FAD synthetase